MWWRMAIPPRIRHTQAGDGQRVKKDSGKLYWYGLNGEVLTKTDLSGNNPNEYVFFGGQQVALRQSDGTVYYYFKDHLGTNRGLVVAGQTSPCYDADFYPYGGERAVLSNCVPVQKLVDAERDSESGLDHMLFRQYSSNLARWLSPDPVAGDVGDPQSPNRYHYVLNNPTNLTDPLGLYDSPLGPISP